MIALVTLEEVKSYLRIDGDAADEDLQGAIYQASAVILDYVKSSRSLIIDDAGKPIEGEELQRVKRSTLIFVGIFDRVKNGEEEHRYSQGNLPFSVTAFIYTLHTPTIV